MKIKYIVFNKLYCDDHNFNFSYKVYETYSLENVINYVEDLIKGNIDKDYYVMEVLSQKTTTTIACSKFIEYYKSYSELLKQLKQQKSFIGAKADKYEN